MNGYYWESKNYKGWVAAPSDEIALRFFNGPRSVTVWRVDDGGRKVLVLKKKRGKLIL